MLEDKCRVLVLDEATSGVDEGTEAVIQRAIRANFENTTILVVAHKLLTVADFDSILVMSQGQVVESGTPQELLRSKGLFWDMVTKSEDAAKMEHIIQKMDNM
ncbi:hypothetical protein V2A60_010378 [Cordyceps javanica]